MTARSEHSSHSDSRPVQWVARIRSIRLAMDSLAGIPQHLLLIFPSTRTALMLAKQICGVRECSVTAGPIANAREWGLAPHTCVPADLAHSFSGAQSLPRSVISFPDQLSGYDLSFAWIPFLRASYLFSIIEALLVLRHRPRVFTLQSCSPSGDFRLTEVFYADLLGSHAHLSSLRALMQRLLATLEIELSEPASDWLAARCMALKSEAHWRFTVREELKDMECLLRLHLLSPACDRLRTGKAVTAVVARQRDVVLAPAPGESQCS
jgi:hypothetical protein